MKQKLIKLSDTHYIIVDDSEIKSKDKFYDFTLKIINEAWLDFGKHITCKKITHSTQPLEPYMEMADYSISKTFGKIKQLSLSEVEEAINGYSVEKIAENLIQFKQDGSYQTMRIDMNYEKRKGFIEGFKTHQELVKDKLFTGEDLANYLNYVEDNYHFHSDTWYDIETDEPVKRATIFFNYKKTLQKTEWDIEFDE